MGKELLVKLLLMSVFLGAILNVSLGKKLKNSVFWLFVISSLVSFIISYFISVVYAVSFWGHFLLSVSVWGALIFGVRLDFAYERHQISRVAKLISSRLENPPEGKVCK